MAGLSAGFAVWGYTLALPSLAKSGWLPAAFLADGLFGVALLRPQQLFGLTGLDEISHALFWSMLANIGMYVGVSLAGRPGVADTQPGRALRGRVPPHPGLRAGPRPGAGAPRSRSCSR